MCSGLVLSQKVIFKYQTSRQDYKGLIHEKKPYYLASSFSQIFPQNIASKTSAYCIFKFRDGVRTADKIAFYVPTED